MDEFEFLLQDRIAKIQAIDKEYNLRDNAYISFSGGKDSTILHYLIDLALPNNKIPRLFLNTGVEYQMLVKFVKGLKEKDDRIVLYNSGVNIRKMLEKDGYPFKSKQHAHNWRIYNNNREEISKYIDMINIDNSLLHNYYFIHYLPKGVKTIIKYIYGVREKVVKVLHTNYPINQYSKYSDDWGQKGYTTEIGKIEEDTHDSVVERVISTSFKDCPNILHYQFKESFDTIKMSDVCCYRLKKENAHRWSQENNKSITITGMRADEGGMRNQNGCTIFDEGKLKKFHPLKVVDDNFEKEFIKRFNIKLCELYSPPYNFERTGCKGCPFALNLQEQLLKLKKLLPSEYKQCLSLWKPVYDEYVRLGYRLDKNFYDIKTQLSLDDFIKE